MVLLLEGLHTLRHGGDVHLVAWGEWAWAASFVLEEQLRLALAEHPPSPPRTAGRIFTHHLKTERQWLSGESEDDWRQRVKREAAGVVAAIQAQAAASPGDTLAILDEADFEAYFGERYVVQYLYIR